MPHNPEKTSLLDRLQVVRDTFGNDPTIVSDVQRKLLSSITDQMSNPTRVVIAGTDQSQHGMLAEFILGVDLYANPNDVNEYPPIRVRYGREVQTFAVVGSSRTRFSGCNIEAAARYSGVTFVDLELPHPILMQLSFIVCPSYDEDEDRTHQLFQLIKTSDVIVWCSNALTPWSAKEARLWRNIPASHKDHSVLMLTGADFVISDEDKQVFEDKCIATDEHFESMVSISVDIARESATGGNILDSESFEVSGGRNAISELLAKATEYEAGLIMQASDLLADLDAFQEAEAERKQKKKIRSTATELELLLLDEEEESQEDSDFQAPAEMPSRAEVKSTLEASIRRSKTALENSEADGFAPLFQQMVETLQTLRGFLRSGLTLTAEHHQVAIQIDEAAELVGLLSYECDGKSAHDAADIVRQVSIDFWARLPSDNVANVIDELLIAQKTPGVNAA